MNSDGDKLYAELVVFDEIYNFIVQTFFIWSHIRLKKWYIVYITAFNIQIWTIYQLIELQDDFKWKKVWTTKL
jgi:hypothetical protein